VRLRPLKTAISLTTVAVCAGDGGTKSLLVFGRSEKCADHAAEVIWHAVVQNVYPEIIPTLIRIASQVAEVLHQHKRRVVFPRLEFPNLHHIQQDLRARLAAVVHRVNLLLHP